MRKRLTVNDGSAPGAKLHQLEPLADPGAEKPRTPLSFAGVARRTAYRGAWYGAAAAGAAVGAAAVAAPYYYRPACGYYPYPPCY